MSVAAADKFAAYDAGRNFGNKAVRSLCYAPHTNLFFDRLGSARVCCWNWNQPAGNVTRDSLDDIWRSAQAAMLRDSLQRYEFAEGCGFCKFQSAEGWFGGSKMRNFDRFEVDAAAPLWPRQMEFSISNACNLECVMCDGEHSSAIRAQRERRPAMARLYTDEILESFRKYLPHLAQAKFLGGEPFLAAEHYKLWDMMLEDGLQTPCHVTTNGTQYNAKIEQLLEKLPFGFAISLDGATKKTIERIRLNTEYDELMRNVRRFRDYARERRSSFSLTYCLMRPNWEEFGDYCLMADEWRCPVGVNTVLFPEGLSLYTLPQDELRKILRVMEQQAVSLETQLGFNKQVWFDEFERLQRKCAAAPAPPIPRPAKPGGFILGIASDDAADQGSIALHFLKKFTKAEITIAQSATARRLPHDCVWDVAVPPDVDAALYLPTHLPALGPGRYCYLQGDIGALRNGLDALLQGTAPLHFALAGVSIDEYSRFAVNCRCTALRCAHFREALLCDFGVDVTDCDWPLRKPSAFSLTAEAAPLLQDWYNTAARAARSPYWRDPAQAGLTAMLWRSNLARQEPLSQDFFAP